MACIGGATLRTRISEGITKHPHWTSGPALHQRAPEKRVGLLLNSEQHCKIPRHQLLWVLERVGSDRGASPTLWLAEEQPVPVLRVAQNNRGGPTYLGRLPSGGAH